MPDANMPRKNRLSAAERRARKSATLRSFIKQYGRQAQKGVEPNDRQYDRRTEDRVKRMDPIELDRLLREDEG